MRPKVQNRKRKQAEPSALTPVDKVIAAFGSARASAIVNLTTDAVRKWNRPTGRGGQGGLVPARFQALYLNIAKAEGLPLTAEDFIVEPRQ